MLRRAPLFFVPLATIVVLLILGFSPQYAAGLSLLTGIFSSVFSKETRPSLRALAGATTQAAKQAASIGSMLAMAGVIVTVFQITLIPAKLTAGIGAWSSGYIALTLVLTMLTSLILGCVAPTAGGYLIVALLAAPILTKMGLSMLQAHMFALFFSVIGQLTPPVAPSALVAAGIANANYLKTCKESIRLIIPVIIVPFLFSYNGAILADFSSGLLLGVASIVMAILCVCCIGIVVYDNYLTKIGWLERALAIISLVGSAAFVITGSTVTVVVGVSCFVLLSLSQWRKRRQFIPAS
jgi:TRAP-type uncharacterized transport system fused permease subunit